VAAVALLDEPTRRRLYDLVTTSDESVGRDDAAAALGISRELAAFHLDRLAAAGLLETEYRRRHGRRGPGAGRPAKLYRRSARVVAASFPPRDYERAAHVLADAVSRLPGATATDVVAGVARQRGAEVGAEVRRQAGPRPSRRRLRAALLDVLDQSGFQPFVDEADGGALRLRNCPYRSLADSHQPLTCGMNVAWAEGVVGALPSPNLDVEFSPTPERCCVALRPARRG
jgi:predicted ArsR family transcriptional regulator